MDYQFFDEQIAAEEKEAVYEVNRELNMAWNIVEETGENLFLTGRAGTGKTTFLKKLRESTTKRMVVLAPTGVAAINARGDTIHSFFQLPLAPYIPGKGFIGNEKRFFRFNRQKRRLIASLSLLVIDEVSMVRPDILDGLDSILRRFRNSPLPFGGLQLLLIGDLRQLPPVVKEKEWELLSPHYNTPYFFESQALKKAGFQTIELTTIYRQNDLKFVSLLNKIRDGEASQDVLSDLNARYISGFNPDDREGYIRLTTHNRRAADINATKLALLPGEEMVFKAEISGEFPEGAFPADDRLILKPGSQVMFIKNDSGIERLYYNGMLGTVTEIDEDSVTVRPHGSETEIILDRVEWENTKYVINEESKKVSQEVVGTFKQFPLRLAWAITIHKSQGLTFEKAIIDAALSFAPGQTYVALSRCRSLEGMVLESRIPPRAVMTDVAINNFVNYCENNAPDADILRNLRGEYVAKLLRELFDFTPLKIAFADFSRYVGEFLSPLYDELEESTQKCTAELNEMEKVGKKFISIYAHSAIDPDTLADNRHLIEKIKSGCRYFSERLAHIERYILKIPRDISNQGHAERLNNTFETLYFILHLRLRMMEMLEEREFSAPDFIDVKARALLETENMTISSPNKNTARRRKKKQ